MKNRFFLLCLIAMFVAVSSCKRKPLDSALVRVSSEALLFTRQADTLTLYLRADTVWQITSDRPWVSLSTDGGSAGRAQVTVVVPDYRDATSDREAMLTIALGGEQHAVTVVQAAGDLAVYPAVLHLPDGAEGGRQTFYVRGTADWTLAIDSTSWFTARSQGGAADALTTVQLTAPINADAGKRKGSFTVRMGSESKTVAVEQDKEHDILTLLETDTVYLSDRGTYRVFHVAASSDWTSVSAKDAELTPSSGKAGITKVHISTKPNPLTDVILYDMQLRMKQEKYNILIEQGGQGQYWNDGEVLTLYKHTRGQGVPIVLIGDGFDRQDLKHGGWWETSARRLVDSFLLKNCIVRDFKDLLDIHVYMAESPERGVFKENMNRFASGQPEIRFDSVMSLINQAADIRKVPDMEPGFSTIFIGNGMVGGYAWFEYRMGVYSTDEPPSDYWMSHEFFGHAFAGMADEYGGPGTYMSMKEMRDYQAQGKCLNVADTKDLARVPWRDFVNRVGYEEVGAFEGGFYADKGVWRPEAFSVMVGWSSEQVQTGPYYDCMCRWMLYRELLSQAGIPFTFEDFLKFDTKYNIK